MTRHQVLWMALLTATAACTGDQGPAGPGGEPCTVVDNGDGTKTVTCPDMPPVTIADGAAGEPCTATDNGDGSKTITCPGSAPVTVEDGADCAVVDNGDGTKTISCVGSTPVTVSDGSSCAVVDNGDGTKTITCPGSPPVTVEDGTDCSVIDSGGGTSILSCTDGTRVIIAPPIDPYLDAWQDLPGAVVDVVALGGASNVDGSFTPGDTVGVTFSVRNAAGGIIPVDELDEAGAWISGPNTNYQHVLPAARDEVMFTDLAARSTLNDDGTYTYVFAVPIPASFGVPLNDTSKFTEGELTGPLTAGTYTLGLMVSKDFWIEGRPFTDANSDAEDFRLDAPALALREVVADGNCNRCHDSIQRHDGKYRSTKMCVTCHTAGAEDLGSTDTGDTTPATIELKVMVHKLHNGIHLPSVNGVTADTSGARVYGTGTPYLVGAEDFSAIKFPAFPNFNNSMPRDSGYSALASANKTKETAVLRGVTACYKCHGDPDGAGPLVAPAQGANAYAAPSRRPCGSCHDDVNFANPYAANGLTMPAGMTDGTCVGCHAPAALTSAHTHPLIDPAIVQDVTIDATALTGASGAGGRFLAGDPIGVTFTIKDAAGTDVPITSMNGLSVDVKGPTQNRQVVLPGQAAQNPVDFAGRLATTSTTNKGAMSKVQPGGSGLVSETLTVQFTSATTYDVTGTVSGALGSGTLPGSPGTQPTGSSIGNVVLASTAVAQQITVAFTGPTVYTVTGSVSGAMGVGTLPATTSNTQRFTSSDGTVSFNVALGTTAAAAGNSFYISIFKGPAANPVLFAIIGGKTAFAFAAPAADRFYYIFAAPAASYTLPAVADFYHELLGDADGTAGQVFTAANLPVWSGRQQLWERTATPGVVMTTTADAAMMKRYLYVAALDPGVAANDILVVDDGTATEEYIVVGAVDTTLRRIALTAAGGSSGYANSPLRYAHAAGATVREVTLAARMEGATSTYVLDPATGTITLNGAATAGNAFLLTYRTGARFGWKRSVSDAAAPFYYCNQFDDPELDETWGDWRGKPMIDGTYTLAIWGTRTFEYSAPGTNEWQTLGNATLPDNVDFLYGATSTTISPYSKIETAAACDACHDQPRFHGGSRRTANACLMCHGTPGIEVNYRTILHGFHAEALPVMPNGAGACYKCHGSTVVFEPTSRNHPTAQVLPTRDWTVPCTGCHTSQSAGAHADTMTSWSSGEEACLTCHGPDREFAVELMHKAR